MLTSVLWSHLALSRPAISVLLAGACVVLSAPASAQTIRKIVDEKGVPYFTNQPPEDDRPQRPAPVVSAPGAPAASEPAASAPKPDLVQKPLPANPSQALGDWPPRPLQVQPVPAK